MRITTLLLIACVFCSFAENTPSKRETNPLTTLQQPSNTVTGNIADVNGEPIVGANVVIKGTATGTVTDYNGYFSIAVDAESTLEITYIGYLKKEILAGNRKNIKIVLTEDTKTLDEVVVVGYGISRKRDLTGSISQVKGTEMENLPVASITGAIVGRVSGVDFVSGSGAPGNSPAIRIRGTGTVNSSDPLIIIDGIVAGDMNQYNPNDVESVEVLKDASAAAIYGTRAANGVILITTKKGQAGSKININLNTYTGVSSPMKTLNLLKAPDLVTLRKEAYANSGLPLDPATDDPNYQYYQFWWNTPFYQTQKTDWQDAYFSKGSIYNADLAIKGGNEKGLFYTSFGYFRDNGIIKPSHFERYSIRINSEYKISGKLKIGQNLQYSLANNEDKSAELWDVLRYNPAIPVTNDDGSWGTVGGNRNFLGDLNNPVMKNSTEETKTTAHRLQGNFTFDFEIIKGLFLKGNYGVNAKLWKTYSFLPFVENQPFPRPNAELRRNYDEEYRLIGETYLTYFKEWADLHTINVSAGYSAEKYRGENFAAERRGFADESKDQRILDNGQNIQNAAGAWKPESALASWYGRAFYSFLDKYLVTLTARADGSSKFPAGNRWAFFPAFSAGWRITEESFMQHVTFVDNLKLTGGWGSLGNQSINDFMYLSTIRKGAGSFNMYNFGGTQIAGSVLEQLGNMSITWEKTNMLNLALEAGFLNNQLTAVLTYFDKNTKDMLLPPVMVGTLGLVGIPPGNIGEMNNHGVEVELSYRNKAGKDFSYHTNLNVTFINNKLTKLYDNDQNKSYIPGPGYGRNTTVISRSYAGDPIGSFYGWKTAGLYQKQSDIDNDPYLKNEDAVRKNAILPGDVRFVDINGDGKIDEADRVNLGNPNPKVVLGLTGGMAYRGFDLSVNFTSNLGAEIYNADKMEGWDITHGYNLYTESMKRWTGEGSGHPIPRMVLSAYNLNNNYRVSDLFIEKGDYLMLRNLAIGYTIPNSIVAKAGVRNLRVYLSGQNLFVVTGYSGMTPELGYSSTTGTYQRGVDVAAYPVTKTITGGISVDF